jgi:hypothetical protein
MPMIDVTAVAGTFSDKPELIKSLTAALMRWEKAPSIPWFVDNTAAFVHDLNPTPWQTQVGTGTDENVKCWAPRFWEDGLVGPAAGRG